MAGSKKNAITYTPTENEGEMEEQIDPSFSTQQTEALIQEGSANQQYSDVAAAAVAATATDAKAEASSTPETPAPATPAHEVVPLSRNGRPLTNTKRAEQNRLAQRAFRQRKEARFRELEAQVAEIKTLKATIDELRAENQELRNYSLQLQAKLIEQPDIPAPPVLFNSTRSKK